MIHDVTDETKHVPDGPEATRHVPDGPLTTPPATPSLSGLPRFGRYQATGKLGEGAMGTVYRAHDEILNRDVAIKSLHGEGDLGMRERFVREARAIGAVHHANILAVHDVGEENKTPFLVIELAANGSLRDHIKAGTIPVETVRECGIQMARALAAAHAANIIHRDVKPANILCAQPGMWKLADFGIAHMPDSTLTITGQFLGSPSYAAPESLRAGEFSQASDVYSLGATLYEALAGMPPHGNHDMQSLIRKLEQEPAPISARRAVPAPLERAIMAALSRDPTKRPSADELARLLAITGDALAVVPAPMGAPSFAPTSAAAIAPNPAPSIAPNGAAIAPNPSGSLTHTTAAPVAGAGTSRTVKLIAAGLAAIALIAIIVAINNRPGAVQHLPRANRPVEGQAADPRAAGESGESGEPGDPGDLRPRGSWDDVIDPSAPEPPGAPQAPQPPGTPMVVDQYGNPVDEETAKEVLEQMERDARESMGRGRGKWKKHKGN